MRNHSEYQKGLWVGIVVGIFAVVGIIVFVLQSAEFDPVLERQKENKQKAKTQ